MDSSADTSGGPAPSADYPNEIDRDQTKHRASDVHDAIVLQGDNSTVTDNRVTIGPTTINMASGGPVLLSAQTNLPPPARRPGSVDLRQSKYTLLDRRRERSSCRADQPGMIELFGEYGIGKSSLLAQLGYDLQQRYPARFADGFAYMNARDISFDDLLYQIWAIFWDINVPWKVQPSTQTMRIQLRNIDALFLLDDPTLSESEFRTLDTALANSTVLLTLDESIVGSFANSVFVGDLDDAYLSRMVRKQCKILHVPKSALTKELLDAILAESRGNPRRCIRAASKALSPRRVPQPEYTADERQVVLETIQSFCSPVPVDALTQLTKLPDAGTIAADLALQAELDAHSPRYTYPWPKKLISTYDDRIRHFVLFEFLNGQDLVHRPDLRDLALEFFEWFAVHPYGAVPRLIRDAMLPTAERLAAQLATAGYIDRWGRLSSAVARLGSSLDDGNIVAWADRNLGVIAMCREDWMSAREHFGAAILHYVQTANDRAVDECNEFLQTVIDAGYGPDEGGGSSSMRPSDPLLPSTGTAATGTESVAESETEAETSELNPIEVERELVRT
ncbi:hypothetical protein [Kribbella sp. VKM Ac-2568]|uniref:hypothetical protein n=1 Tax=Kribbella sp. VKM Ac-2568 TaxID=2512219 RepID=UPI00104E07F0|nr:hypothetical protein [Kribbella sp. VKM Ac-2568]